MTKESCVVLVSSVLALIFWGIGVAMQADSSTLAGSLLACLEIAAFTPTIYIIGRRFWAPIGDYLLERKAKKVNKQLELLNSHGTSKDVWDFANKYGVCLTNSVTAIMFDRCDPALVAQFTMSLYHILITDLRFEETVWNTHEMSEVAKKTIIEPSIGRALAEHPDGDWARNFLDAIHHSRHSYLYDGIFVCYKHALAELQKERSALSTEEHRKRIRKSLGLKPEIE